MTSPNSTAPFQETDEQRFRELMGHFATGVVAVTGADTDHAPLGLTATSFTSVSLTPPLVSFCVARTSRTWPRLRLSQGICVNILSDRQQDLAACLAHSGEHKFRGLAWLEGGVVAEHPAGDHDIVVIGVHRLGITGRADPLVRYRGAYRRLTRLDEPVNQAPGTQPPAPGTVSRSRRTISHEGEARE